MPVPIHSTTITKSTPKIDAFCRFDLEKVLRAHFSQNFPSEMDRSASLWMKECKAQEREQTEKKCGVGW